MDVIAYLICFAIVMINIFGKGDIEPISFGTALIGLGLCSIAGAINNFRLDRTNKGGSRDGSVRQNRND